MPFTIGVQPVNSPNSKRIKLAAEFGVLHQFELGGDKNYFRKLYASSNFNTSILSFQYHFNMV
jgi:hypothetical protein